MRLAQSLFDRNSVRLQCFVDDPIAAVKGTALKRRTIVAIMTLVWEALGCQLSYTKGQFGAHAEWIGGELTLSKETLAAKVKEAIIKDITMMLDKFANANFSQKKELESFIGKVNHAAGLLVTIRPFLQPLGAALYGLANKEIPGTIWTKQVEHSITWLRAVFYHDTPGVVRRFHLADFLGKGDKVEVGTDASAHGLGGGYQGEMTRNAPQREWQSPFATTSDRDH